MKLEPRGHQLLVRIDDVEERTEGGIILADEYRQREKGGNITGTVKAMGNLAYADFNDAFCSVGDHVVMERYAGFVPRFPGLSEDKAQNWRLVEDTEVRAVISEDGVDLDE